MTSSTSDPRVRGRLGQTLNVGIVDTDTGFVQVLANRLEAAEVAFRVVRGRVGAEGLVPMRLNALVVDPAVYGSDAWTQLEAIRTRLPNLALVVCTGRTSVGQRVRGLRLGVDDWITKPCHPEEVIARVEAIARRRQRSEARELEAAVIGELEVRPDHFQAYVNGVSADFTRREFELLQLLAEANGQVLPREEIYERVWGYAMAHGDRSVDVFVRKLRQKLDRLSPRWRYIHTHFGIGYRLSAEPAEPQEPVPTSPRADPQPTEPASPISALIIGHRGASGHRPEHTLASYALAARMGADYIEPDLVSTSDGVLVARHENEISATTDVADHPEFAARKTTKTIDGASLTGWFAEDFTLAELRTLRAKERIPQIRQRNTLYDGRYRIPTFQGVIDLAQRLTRELGRPVGIYPETKHPSYFRSIGLALEDPLVAELRANKLDKAKSKVFVQSFEVGNLKALDRRIDVPLVQLLGAPAAEPADDPRTYAELATPAGLAGIAAYADGVGPSKDYIVPRDASGASLAPTSFVADAHAAGLVVHPYTFRNENTFLPLELRRGSEPTAWGNAIGEYEQFIGLGVDGLFSDYPDTAVDARDGAVD